MHVAISYIEQQGGSSFYRGTSGPGVYIYSRQKNHNQIFTQTLTGAYTDIITSERYRINSQDSHGHHTARCKIRRISERKVNYHLFDAADTESETCAHSHSCHYQPPRRHYTQSCECREPVDTPTSLEHDSIYTSLQYHCITTGGNPLEN